ncbi:hypothetical protein CLAFUW4_05149 [Fulvia fulva]|uniref:F-box domain-containing protein n=1 Tax=Passalora fulva TaxID=5499 RepID=A0A9Q8PIC1_PASFU|nr:uncharacterized protein CLAFUR5_11756 [Fulvia fulva]KAK4627312.1 hypothetical protein CLAFUR4_05135 [Fulvia fulva]KAK4628183.1 hypothetical protein CLAFUR0_05141 [Fulvia fulva]UJO22940.1 hypothetical protein CLAFUR5_11756 [Fulvia fulva]WPV14097.1 hypothetical protein CLAFUW4_05149 [Fulvia fulva]WPV29132.1 hypothetical protein CLAFUW7_05145 [Fulvia fulva]
MCPPGVDQTERSLQQWALLTPRLEQIINLPYPRGYSERKIHSPASYVSNSWSFSAFQMLSGVAVDRYIPECLATARIATQLSLVESLPAELLMSILEHDLAREDIMAVGLCSSTLWTHVLNHIARDLRDTVSNWAGTPLICAGTYLKDLPPALQEFVPGYAEQQRVYLDRTLNRRKGMPMLRNKMPPARRYNWDARSSFEHVPDRQHAVHSWMMIFCHVCNEEEPMKTALTSSLRRALRWRQHDQGGAWLLRNLTSKEFVALDVKDDGVHHIEATVKAEAWLSLDRALLQRICWSRFSPDLFEDQCEDEREVQERCHRGVWAGHCFDVVREAKVSTEEWIDVREVLIEEAKAAQAPKIELDSTEDEEGEE